MTSTAKKPVLTCQEIVKRYPGVLALDRVHLDIKHGEVHGLIGENGAGKSTLMKILAGVISSDEGEIQLDGVPVKFSNPRHANDLGIALVHQELNLVPHLSVADNIFLGRELVSKTGLIRVQEQNLACAELLCGLDKNIDPRSEVCQLRVGQQQIVEIAKALNSQSRVIFMDEPTSALSDSEVNALYKMIRSLRESGVSVVYVSHKLDELLSITDRITVLRDGKFVQTVETANTDRETVVRLMVGRHLNELYVHSHPLQGCVERLRVENLTLIRNGAHRPVVDQLSFSANSGEVLGIFGLMGAGRTEMLEAIYGLYPRRTSGSIAIDGVPTRILSPSHALKQGIGLVPEDRKLQGLILRMSVEQNISLSSLSEFEKWWLLSRRGEREHAKNCQQQFAIKSPTLEQAVRTLSGGNQQKVVLSKVLSRKPKVLMLDEPTRGIDVNAKRELYGLVDRLKCEGMAVIIVSSELPEILGISDRILVMCEGCKTAEFDRASMNEEVLMQAAVPKQRPARRLE